MSGKNDAWVAPATKTSEIPTVEVSNLLRDTIPFTFGNGTYSVLLEKKTTIGNTYVAIPLEVHEWFLDTDVGVLTFLEALLVAHLALPGLMIKFLTYLFQI